MRRDKRLEARAKAVPTGSRPMDIACLTPLTKTSLDKHIAKSTYSEGDLLKLTAALAATASSFDSLTIADIATLGKTALANSRAVSPNNAILLLFHCAAYYERTGEAQKGLTLMETALVYATELGNVDLQRRSHNMLGILYSRNCDFANSCSHLEIAYNLAGEMKSTFLEFSALANAVASLETMGLLHWARDLALKISARFKEDSALDRLHIPNAANGIIISHLIGDIESAKTFYEICLRAADTSILLVDELTRAYFEAARATHLTAVGDKASALSHINEAIAWGTTRENIRIDAVLFGAQAEVHLAIGDEETIRQSQDKLGRLLEHTSSLPWHHEDLLRTLFKLRSVRSIARTRADREKALNVLRALREHLIGVKHSQFYSKDACRLPKRLGEPSYAIPKWIRDAGAASTKASLNATIPASDGQESVNGVDDQVISVSGEIAKWGCSKTEIRMRTPLYHIAENWAVAADFAAGGRGRDCIRVGRLASMVAIELGMSREKSIAIGLASRLRNVGTVFIGLTKAELESHRSFGRFSPISHHTTVGENVLGCYPDPLFMLASSIAKSHHEWWNGCGYPLGLSETSIPLEGRICLLADTFISLVTPFQRHRPWHMDAALHQIESMAGLQIDPELIDPLRRVLRRIQVADSRLTSTSIIGFEGQQSANSKKQLFAILETLSV